MPGARTLAGEMQDGAIAEKLRGFFLGQLVKLHRDRWRVFGGPAEHMLLLSYTTRGEGENGLYPVHPLAATNETKYVAYPLDQVFVSGGAPGYLQSAVPGWKDETHVVLALALVAYAISTSDTEAGPAASPATVYFVTFADGSTSMFEVVPDGTPQFLHASHPIGVECLQMPAAPIPPSDDHRYRMIALKSEHQPGVMTEYLSLIMGQLSRP